MALPRRAPTAADQLILIRTRMFAKRNAREILALHTHKARTRTDAHSYFACLAYLQCNRGEKRLIDMACRCCRRLQCALRFDGEAHSQSTHSWSPAKCISLIKSRPLARSDAARVLPVTHRDSVRTSIECNTRGRADSQPNSRTPSRAASRPVSRTALV